MAGLSSAGIGSGLDVAGLVSKLIDAERTPVLTRLAGKEATLQAQLSGFGLLRGALDKLKSALDGLAAPTLLTAYTRALRWMRTKCPANSAASDRRESRISRRACGVRTQTYLCSARK